MDCSSNQRARQGARCAMDMLPAELFPLVARLLPAADLGRTEATSRALRAAVERVVRERAAGWGGSGTGAVERVAGESWERLSSFIELRTQAAPGCVAAGGYHSRSLHASSKAAAHACCGGAPAPFSRPATDRARHRFRRSLFCRRTAEPSHTAATMWPKHAPATSAPTTNSLCRPRGFHVHASTAVPMCLHHAHLLPPGRPAPPLRRVRRALIANQPKKGRRCPRRKMIAAKKLTSRDDF